MVIPIIILVTIPIFLGIVYSPPFDLPEEPDEKMISDEENVDILYFLLMGIWVIILIRILIQIKKRTFKITRRF